MKRVFDLVVGLITLLFALIPMLLIALSIRTTSKGAVLYWSDRIGQVNKIFKMPKFRTMQVETPVVATHLMANPDKYLSSFGGFLRRSSLDELPQFFNSLIGNMSVVGPRPIVEKELEKYHRFAPKLLTVKPGVTGLWQVSGRNDIDYDERVAMDMEYIDNQTFFGDIKIIIQTVLVMIFRKGAY